MSNKNKAFSLYGFNATPFHLPNAPLPYAAYDGANKTVCLAGIFTFRHNHTQDKAKQLHHPFCALVALRDSDMLVPRSAPNGYWQQAEYEKFANRIITNKRTQDFVEKKMKELVKKHFSKSLFVSPNSLVCDICAATSPKMHARLVQLAEDRAGADYPFRSPNSGSPIVF